MIWEFSKVLLCGFSFFGNYFYLGCYCLQVIYNRETDRSRGFGFVTMSTVEEAEKAVEMFNRYVSCFCKVLLLVILCS